MTEQSQQGGERQRKHQLTEAIGRQIKRLREVHSFSNKELASAAGISRGFLSRIEQGKVLPSITTLDAIARSLQVPLTSLIDVDERTSFTAFTKAGTGTRLDSKFDTAEFLGGASPGSIDLVPLRVTLSSKSDKVTLPSKGWVLIYVIEGAIIYAYKERYDLMQVGDSIFLNAAAVHGIKEVLCLPTILLIVSAHLRV